VEGHRLTRVVVPTVSRESVARRAPKVQEAMRRRLAERAFEEHVREMARRWARAPVPRSHGPGTGDALPKV